MTVSGGQGQMAPTYNFLKFQDSDRTYLKQTKQTNRGRCLRTSTGIHMHAHTCKRDNAKGQTWNKPQTPLQRSRTPVARSVTSLWAPFPQPRVLAALCLPASRDTERPGLPSMSGVLGRTGPFRNSQDPQYLLPSPAEMRFYAYYQEINIES